jgi:glycosyltransferase involved in cell wall biosynthesis
MSTPQRVVVYEPDGINPYGREVAGLLASVGLDVELLLPRDAVWRPDGVRVRDTLPRNGPATRYLQAWALFRTLCRCLLTAARDRDTAWLVIWTRSVADELVFGLLAALGKPVTVVVHNPTDRQPQGLLRSRTGTFLRRRAGVCVVHSEALGTMLRARDGVQSIRVCPHPPYAGWWKRYGAPRTRPGLSTELLVLGQLQPHKGLDELPGILAELPALSRSRLRLTVCGKGTLDPNLAAALSDQVSLRDRTGPTFISDEELAAELRRADLLLAPYKGATQSGTVALALSAGIRVVAYDDGALRDLVDDSGLVARGDRVAFAKTLASAAGGIPVGRPRTPLDTWQSDAAIAWAAAVRYPSTTVAN